MGKLLRVNLTRQTITSEEPDGSYYGQYLGGRGIIIYTLLTEVPTDADPLGPQNKLIFATGLLTGHKLIGTGRASVGSKSPLSGGYGESEAGGFWGAELRRAGYDGIIIEGTAKRPVYLWINNDNVEIRDAAKVWGAEVGPSVDWFREDTGVGKCKTATIGPAGERLVSYANIIVDYRSAFGRTGMGAVMGGKRLKGIAVKGDKYPLAADKKGVSQLNLKMKERYKDSPFVRYGTGGAMKTFEAVGNLPVRNHSGGPFPGIEKIDAPSLLEHYGTGMVGCFNCPIRCKKNIRIEKGPWPVESRYGGPEYETLASFGSNLLIDDLQAICKAGEMCNRYGIDTISTGATIAFAMECFENGILSTEETNGLELNFGNAEAMIQAVEMIALRQGIGDLLAKGTRKAAEVIGRDSNRFAMHVKGVELPYHEPRYKQGLGLHYTVHGAGPDHNTGFMDDAIGKVAEDWDSLSRFELIPPSELSPRKVRYLSEMGLWKEMCNHLGLCIFVPWSISEVQEAVCAITGWKLTAWKLMKAVERGITMMRIFNLREGLTRDEDKLPDRFFTSPSNGPLKNVRIDPIALREAQEVYYQIRGWDRSGVPTRGCLVGLDLEWAIPQLEG
ncbi:MAG: aldehyde ferredoxin oxidoreductase family protein [Pseudomonadota bacterium]